MKKYVERNESHCIIRSCDCKLLAKFIANGEEKFICKNHVNKLKKIWIGPKCEMPEFLKAL